MDLRVNWRDNNTKEAKTQTKKILTNRIIRSDHPVAAAANYYTHYFRSSGGWNSFYKTSSAERTTKHLVYMYSCIICCKKYIYFKIDISCSFRAKHSGNMSRAVIFCDFRCRSGHLVPVRPRKKNGLLSHCISFFV